MRTEDLLKQSQSLARELQSQQEELQQTNAELEEKAKLLVDQNVLTKMWVLRRILMQMGTVDAMQFLLDKMKDAKSNEDFFASMNQ